jgi:hypothetical protein
VECVWRSLSDGGWALHARGFFEDHLDPVLETHSLEGLLALQIILLVDLMQVLDLLAPLVLLIEIQ